MRGAFVVLVALAAGGCGDSGESADSGTLDPARIQAAVDSIRLLPPAMAAMDGQGAAMRLTDFTIKATSILLPTALPMLHASGAGFYVLAGGGTPSPSAFSCVTNGCAFNYEGTEMLYYAASYRGSIDRRGDQLEFEIRSGTSFRNSSGASSMSTGALTLTSSSLSGTVTAHGDSHAQSGVDDRVANQAAGDFTVTFQDVVLDVNGCAISGAVSATLMYDATNGWEASFDLAGETTVIPYCP